MSKNEGERVTATDEVVAAAEAELASDESSKDRVKRKHEVRADGSIAYFDELEETAAERESAGAAIPARELGTQ